MYVLSIMNKIASGQLADAAAYALHSADGSTFKDEMPSWPSSWKHDVISKIWLGQSKRIYSQNNPVEFHLDPIWNNGDFDF